MPDAPLGLWGLLSALLLLSGSFSASETALFSLRPEERSAAPARLRRLLDRPRDLLVTVLLGNLLINILFFADAGGVPTGTPVDLIPGTAIAARQVMVTGTEAFAGDTTIARYEASFDPVLLNDGVPYWVVFSALGAFDFDEAANAGPGWAWWGNDEAGNGGNAHQGGTDFSSTWFNQQRIQAFSLTAVPEPSVVGIIALAGGALLLHRRTRMPSAY